MPLVRRKRENQEYFYFTIGSRRFYLGTLDYPRADRVKEAIGYLNEYIREYQQQKTELETLLTTAEKTERERIKSLSDEELDTQINTHQNYITMLQAEKERRKLKK